KSVRNVEFCDEAKLTVIENGIDLSRFAAADGASLRAELRADAGRKIVGCVSRLAPEKGIEVLIRAMARVGRDALLLLGGDGPGVEDCRALAASLGLGDHVRLLGLRDDVERIYAAADVMVMPSLWDEAFGLVVVEAMAAGRPVVVTRSGAMPELVGDGRGVIVPKRDEVAMAGAIGRLLDDDSLRARMGQAARAHAAERYGMPVWVARIMAEYAALVPALAARRAA
ncbi:MAG: glycosyltransferase family 4 protein, partial [Myxococcales bacterium]|nr:glycosyltransferase family 4 protein [Myxococcales bacterium]